jgi:hypothetical protein
MGLRRHSEGCDDLPAVTMQDLMEAKVNIMIKTEESYQDGLYL